MNETPSTDTFITAVVESEACKRHDRPKGVPCWHIFGVNGNISAAICNKRAKAVGYSGAIDPKSLRKFK